MKESCYTNSWYPIGHISQALGVDPDYLQSIKHEIDRQFYYYGKHFKVPYEGSENQSIGQEQDLLVLEQILNVLSVHPGWEIHLSRVCQKPIAVCNAYFDWKARLVQGGFTVNAPIWDINESSNELDSLIYYSCTLVRKLLNVDFQFLISERFIRALDLLKSYLGKYYSHPAYFALVVPYNLPYFEYIANHIFQVLGRKTFLAVHGLSHSYSLWSACNVFPFNAEKYLTDYFLVWGEEIARQFPKHGVPRERVLVTGHPDYDIKLCSSPKFSLENILVCTRAMPGAPMMNLPIDQNRADLIDYVYQIQIALQKVGVTQARLRLHPSESPDWYRKFIDQRFFSIDGLDLKDSLSQATLVIGPASTVFIDSLFEGVNYTIFDPYSEQGFFDHQIPDPPFDGSNPQIPVAKTIDQLTDLLKTKNLVDYRCMEGFIKCPFDLNPFIEVLR